MHTDLYSKGQYKKKNHSYHVEDSEFKWKIFKNILVTMIHGNKDNSVPVIYSKKVLKIFKNSQKKLLIIKNGDHSLSSPNNLRILKRELQLIINQLF